MFPNIELPRGKFVVNSSSFLFKETHEWTALHTSRIEIQRIDLRYLELLKVFPNDYTGYFSIWVEHFLERNSVSMPQT